MGDWIGLGFFVLLIAAVLIGLKVLSKPRTHTSDEFERNAAENKTMLGAMMNALHDVTDPSAVKAREVREQMKDGRYLKKKREGKAGGEEHAGDDEIIEETTND